MKKLRNIFLLLTVMMSSCVFDAPSSAKESKLVATPTLSPPQVNITSVPDVQSFANSFLQSWQQFDYETMYAKISLISQDAYTKEIFKAVYTDTTINMAIQKLDYEILATLTNPQSAQVAYRVIYHSAILDDLQKDMVMNIILENGEWKVQWEEGLVLPELSGGNHVAIDLEIPARGSIYDNAGNAIATQTQAYAFGIVPGRIDNSRALISELMHLTGLTSDEIVAKYENAADDWYIAIGDAPAQDVEEHYRVLSQLDGLVMTPYESRYYFDDGLAPQTIGYAMAIPVEQAEEYRRKGYRGDEMVGMAGIEKWSENDLIGKRGASLYVVDPKGQIVTRLAQTEPEASQSVYTTLDRNLQLRAQKALDGFSGAIVVLERDTGRVLAMVSSPTFNPNLFDANNANRDQLLEPMLNDGQQRLLNRSTQGGYPLGSVFKIITTAAALESGFYTAETTYNCQYDFTELPGITLYDWTLDKEVAASGLLTLPEGLMRSCNPFFWHIGLDLYRRGLTNALSDMARGFGLGTATGIGEVAEDTGSISDPINEGDAVQLAIGQGTMLVTPLQVAVFIAAIGNGGTLYRPQVIEKVVSPDDISSFTFQPQINGYLPIKPDTLQIIRGAMHRVVTDLKGTAHKYFIGVDVPVSGKTGTAQNPMGDAHAWFAGYTDNPDSDKPDIAVVVIAENAGEGSEVGAPIFRRILEIYYDGKPSVLYPWESRMYITKTPTREFTETPEPTSSVGNNSSNPAVVDTPVP